MLVPPGHGAFLAGQMGAAADPAMVAMRAVALRGPPLPGGGVGVRHDQCSRLVGWCGLSRLKAGIATSKVSPVAVTSM